MKMKTPNRYQLQLVADGSSSSLTPGEVARAFDPARLTQARQVAGKTKREVAEALGVTPAAIGQYEAGTTRPRPDLIPRLADILGVPTRFFLAGRPHAKLDASMAHFRSLRSTSAYKRAKAAAFVEQVWELTYALEKRVQMPLVDLPGFAGGEVLPTVNVPLEPLAAARALRSQWGLGTGPIAHLVRVMESHGVVVTMLPLSDPEDATVDAFSTSRLPRPLVGLTPDRANDVYRYRFTAAHELGHLLLHGEAAPGDAQQEREADAFAAEFLTPRATILPALPTRIDFTILAELQRRWGVSIKSLLYRCREVGLLSSSAASRAYQRLNVLQQQGAFPEEPITAYSGECAVLLTKAFELAASHGLGLTQLADELAWPVSRLRELLNVPDSRPTLHLITQPAP